MHGIKVRIIRITILILSFFTINTSIGFMQFEDPFFRSSSWSYDGSRIAIIEGATILIYDANSGELLHQLTGHTDPINSVSWSPIDLRLASAGYDQIVKVWDTDTSEHLRDFMGHDETIMYVTWSPDGTRIISSEIGMDNPPDFLVWNAQTGELIIRIMRGNIADAAFSPDGSMFAMSHSLGLSIRDGETFQQIIMSPSALCCTNRMETLAWRPDSTQIVTGSINGLITIWDAATLTQVRQFHANPYYVQDAIGALNLNLSWVRDVSWGLDGNIQAISGDGTIRQWDSEGNLLQEAHTNALNTASWSPYGARLAIQELTTYSLTSSQTRSDSRLQIVVPFVSIDQLHTLATLCGDPLSTDDIDEMINLSDERGMISSACNADLLAVANALQNQSINDD